MAASQILRFCQTDTGTNLLSQAAYLADSQRENGNQPGTARAQLVNKTLRQSSLMAAGLAKWIADHQGVDVVDTLTDTNIGAMMQAAFEAVFADLLAASQVQRPGSMMMWPVATVPSGWVKRNGAALSRTTYAGLFAVLSTNFGVGDGSTTFNVPDDRAIFERGWDDSRGVDPGRTLGSTQASQNLSHNHTGSADSAGGHVHNMATLTTFNGNAFGIPFLVNGPYSGPGGNSSITAGAMETAGAHTHTLTINASGGIEARPFNRAYVPIIKF